MTRIGRQGGAAVERAFDEVAGTPSANGTVTNLRDGSGGREYQYVAKKRRT